MAKYDFLVKEARKYATATKGPLAGLPGLPVAIVPQYGPDAPALLRAAVKAGAVKIIERAPTGRKRQYVVPA